MIAKTNLRDSYKSYKRKCENPVDIKVYLKIVLGFIRFLMKKVFDGYDVELSAGRSLGTIGIRGKKIKPILDKEGNVIAGLATDWKATNEYRASNPEAAANKERIYHLNEHTNGYSFGLKWWTEGMKVTHKRIYFLLFCRFNKRTVPKMIYSGKEYLHKL